MFLSGILGDWRIVKNLWEDDPHLYTSLKFLKLKVIFHVITLSRLLLSCDAESFLF